MAIHEDIIANKLAIADLQAQVKALRDTIATMQADIGKGAPSAEIPTGGDGSNTSSIPVEKSFVSK